MKRSEKAQNGSRRLEHLSSLWLRRFMCVEALFSSRRSVFRVYDCEPEFLRDSFVEVPVSQQAISFLSRNCSIQSEPFTSFEKQCRDVEANAGYELVIGFHRG